MYDWVYSNYLFSYIYIHSLLLSSLHLKLEFPVDFISNRLRAKYKVHLISTTIKLSLGYHYRLFCILYMCRNIMEILYRYIVNLNSTQLNMIKPFGISRKWNISNISIIQLSIFLYSICLFVGVKNAMVQVWKHF